MPITVDRWTASKLPGGCPPALNTAIFRYQKSLTEKRSSAKLFACSLAAMCLYLQAAQVIAPHELAADAALVDVSVGPSPCPALRLSMHSARGVRSALSIAYMSHEPDPLLK